jgi:hypothetical protein
MSKKANLNTKLEVLELQVLPTHNGNPEVVTAFTRATSERNSLNGYRGNMDFPLMEAGRSYMILCDNDQQEYVARSVGRRVGHYKRNHNTNFVASVRSYGVPGGVSLRVDRV